MNESPVSKPSSIDFKETKRHCKLVGGYKDTRNEVDMAFTKQLLQHVEELSLDPSTVSISDERQFRSVMLTCFTFVLLIG